jgi:hypothetical protein
MAQRVEKEDEGLLRYRYIWIKCSVRMIYIVQLIAEGLVSTVTALGSMHCRPFRKVTEPLE